MINKKILLIIFLLSLTLVACNQESVNEEVIIENNLTLEEQKDLAITNWINENAYEITSLTSDDYSDLEFLKPILEDKRVVFLGESSHGVGEFSQAKTRLIKYLHEELDYDVIAFESGLAETSAAYMDISSLTSEELMENSIFSIWHSTETLELFSYIKEEYEADDPLILTGFDIQPSSPYYGSFLKEWFYYVDVDIAELAYDVESKVSNYYLDHNREGFLKEKEYLISSYEKIIEFINNNENELQEVYPLEEDIIIITNKVLENRIIAINDFFSGQYDIFDSKNLSKVYEIRDNMMAENLTWVIEELYPDKKIIVWAHNVHIRERNSETSFFYIPLMGELLPDSIKKDSYVMGLYFYQGKIATNDRTIIEVDSGYNLEDYLNRSKYQYSFLNLEDIEKVQANEWVFQVQNSYQQFKDKLVLKDQYDGVLFIKEVNPPDYINFEQ